MIITKVYPNGNFEVESNNNRFGVRQVTHSKPVKVGDEVTFTDYKFHTVKVTEDGRQQSKVIILSFGFEVV